MTYPSRDGFACGCGQTVELQDVECAAWEFSLASNVFRSHAGRNERDVVVGLEPGAYAQTFIRTGIMSDPILEPIAAPVQAPDNALAMAARLVGQCEGCRLAPYQDNGRGVWTIGIGSIQIDGQPVTADTPPITQEQAWALMMDELRPTAALVDEMLAVPAVGQRSVEIHEYDRTLIPLDHSIL